MRKMAPPPGETTITVPVNWFPWEHQRRLWDRVMKKGCRKACVVWHRRAGKDHTVINMAAVKMFERHGTYWHVLPTYTQGEKVIWNGIDSDGRKFIDYVPKQAVASRRNDKMLLQLHDELGGSQYQVVGGDNPDRLVGGNPIFVGFSEYALMNPMGWDLVRPIINANDGTVVFIFTPRGYNHAFKLLEAARESEEWFTEVLDITQTKRPDGRPIVTEEQVKEEIRMGMPEELARQEYYCDFTAPLVGAYYGREFDEMDKAQSPRRLSPEVKWMKGQPVHTCWDLGIRDTMVVWFFQVIDGWVNWIDLMAATGEGIEYFAKELDRKPYVYGKHYAPHDANKREIGTGKTILRTAGDLGLRFRLVPKTKSVDNDINACRLVLQRSRFNTETCDQGVNALRHYRKEWDIKSRVWSAKPVHDWTSHFADAFRTGAMAMPREVISIPTAPVFQDEQTFDDVLSEHDRLVSESRQTGYKKI